MATKALMDKGTLTRIVKASDGEMGNFFYTALLQFSRDILQWGSRVEQHMTAEYGRKAVDAGSRLEHKLRKMKGTQFLAAAYLRICYGSCGKEYLLAYNKAMKGDLDYAHRYFLDAGEYYGLLFVADKYLERAEEQFRKKEDISITEVQEAIAPAFKIYTEELGDLNWNDANLLRIATLFRNSSFTHYAGALENNYSSLLNRAKRKWAKRTTFRKKAPILPRKEDEKRFAYAEREKAVETIVSSINGFFQRRAKRKELSCAKDDILLGYLALQKGDYKDALDFFTSMNYMPGLLDLEKKAQPQTDLILKIQDARINLIEAAKKTEEERIALRTETLRLFMGRK